MEERAQILVNEEEDGRLLDRCEAKRKEWATHWQCAEEVQKMGSTAKAERVSLGRSVEIVPSKNRSVTASTLRSTRT